MSMTPVPVCWQTTVTAENEKESCSTGFSACGGSRKRHSTIPPQCASSRSIFIVWKRSFLYDKDNKECALAHSRAEARLL